MTESVSTPRHSVPLTHRVPKATVAAGLLYLLLPNLLFLLGWVQPLAAIPLSAVLIMGAVFVYRRLPVRHILLTRKDWMGFALALACSLLVVELISFHGHIQQAGDFYVRNPIYQTLIREDWPICSERGECFVYYFSFWLPPAMVAKTTGLLSSDTLLFCWSYLGVAIALSLAFLRLKGRILPFFIIFILLGSVTHFIEFIDPSALEWHTHNGGHQGFWQICQSVCAWFQCIIYPAGSEQFFSTFNHAVPLFILICFIISKSTPKASLPFISTLVLSATPLGGVAVLPLLLLTLAPVIMQNGVTRILKKNSLYCGLLFIPILALFFTQNESGCKFLLWNSDFTSRQDFIFILSAYLFHITCILLPMWYFLRRRFTMNAHGLSAVFLCIALPLVFVGQANNELLFKGAMVMFASLALLYTSWWGHAPGNMKKLFAAILLLSSGMFTVRAYTCFRTLSFSPEGIQQNIMNEWNGHLNHPEHWAYKQFWVEKLPPPFYFKPGESILSPTVSSQNRNTHNK